MKTMLGAHNPERETPTGLKSQMVGPLAQSIKAYFWAKPPLTGYYMEYSPGGCNPLFTT